MNVEREGGEREEGAGDREGAEGGEGKGEGWL